MSQASWQRSRDAATAAKTVLEVSYLPSEAIFKKIVPSDDQRTLSRQLAEGSDEVR